ncbi:SLC13 family permease [Sporolituus thermophilus]|uniref:Sodium-dependent dicarboxylate transporter SdcS n=1 Tax=Sporolituus thermophilus DSM 23256 TaxID=1123285 RepID=A0A1G7JUP2_9FIRM|nr:DASS family sodium-coupled anion symporter [Sporolituus thermophilus]SDF28656.1 anion transporter [Sporolituus thermophilus DSM 23256]
MSRQKWLALVLAFAALAAIVWFTPAIAGLKASGKAALGVAVFAIIIWATQAVDDALSGLMIVFLLASLNATSLGNAFSGYANTALWLIVIGFIMAACMEKSGLSKRIALILVNAAGGSAGKVYWAVAAVMAVMSFLVPSITARTLLMLPIILGIGQAFDAKQGQSNIVKALLFIVAMSGTMMSIGILTAHVGNPITVGLIESATKKVISWSEWFRVGGPPAFTLAFISVYVLRLMWKPEIESLGQGQDYVRRELAALGPLSKQELYTLVVFLVTLVLWATDSLHKVNVVLVGLLAVLLLLWPGRGVMNWKEAQQKVPWNVFIVYGAGLSMGTALVSSGAAKWLAGTMLSPIANMPHAMQIIVLIWIVTALQVFFTGGGPKTTALTPVVIAHAVAIGADPLVFALILGMNMQHQYLLPVSNMPNAVAMGTGHITAGELFRTGLVMSILGAAFMSAMVLTYWKWIGIVQ